MRPDKGQQGDMARALQGDRQSPLMARTGSRLATGLDFTTLGQIAPQAGHIFIVDIGQLLGTKAADFTARHKAVLRFGPPAGGPAARTPGARAPRPAGARAAKAPRPGSAVAARPGPAALTAVAARPGPAALAAKAARPGPAALAAKAARPGPAALARPLGAGLAARCIGCTGSWCSHWLPFLLCGERPASRGTLAIN